MAKSGKMRLDRLLVARGLVESRSKAQGLIMAGEVLVDGAPVDKAGTAVLPDAQVELKQTLPYVGRGGFKLAHALEQFEIDVNGRVCADVGACTGGFTDVLLQNGARQVIAIDVGYGQLAWKLRQDERVTVMERTNARYLTELEQPISFACIDVSFISLQLILPAVVQWLSDETKTDIVALVKPQFEAGREHVGKGGIVRDTAVHRQVLQELVAWVETIGVGALGVVNSPITGSEGNVEFLLWLRRGGETAVGEPEIEQALNAVQDQDGT